MQLTVFSLEIINCQEELIIHIEKSKSSTLGQDQCFLHLHLRWGMQTSEFCVFLECSKDAVKFWLAAHFGH